MKPYSVSVLLALLSLLACPSVGAQSTNSTGETPQYRSQRALAEYYQCVKTYALKYTKTSAPATDVAEAALSACANAGKALHSANLAFVESIDTAERLQSIATDAARRFAIQSVLEARFQVHE